MEERTLRCPNCGANATNHDNCEYCGSLLVRFVEKGIDLSNTSYLNNTEVFSGLIKELEQNLAMQEQGDKSTITDIYRSKEKVNYVGAEICVLRTGKCIWSDKQKILLSKSNKGLVIALDFSTYINDSDPEDAKFNQEQERKLELFKQLPSYKLFTPHKGFFTQDDVEFKCIQYAIDFGEDAEGAARLISELLIKVREIPLDENIEFYTNYGHDKVKESRRMVHKLMGDEEDDENDEDYDYTDNKGKSWPAWHYWVAGIILVLWWLLS